MFLDCQSLFIRHTESKKCIAAANSTFKTDSWGDRYWAEMVNNCLDEYAQFLYLGDKPLLHNIKTGGTLGSYDSDSKYKKRVFVYRGKNINGKQFEKGDTIRLKQKSTRSLYFYDKDEKTCAQPNGNYIDAKKNGCNDASVQKFTFGKDCLDLT